MDRDEVQYPISVIAYVTNVTVLFLTTLHELDIHSTDPTWFQSVP
jgi:hypothetical protein